MAKKAFDIFEEGFQVMEGTGRAHYVGTGYGKTFIEACEEFIDRTGRGEIRTGRDGKKYACDWGCQWYETLSEAQRPFG